MHFDGSIIKADFHSNPETLESYVELRIMIDVEEEFILDGFPRTLPQAEWLIAQHKAGLINISTVLNLEADEQVVTRRLLSRGRQDDTKEAVASRFSEYRAITLPIIKDLEKNGIKVHHINGQGTPEEVHAQITPLLK